MKRLLLFLLNICLLYAFVPAQSTYVNIEKPVTKSGHTIIRSFSKKVVNKDCLHALELAVDAKTKDINKLYGGDSQSKKSSKHKTDLWYSFLAPDCGHVSIITSMELSDDISIYSGLCGEMKEICAEVVGNQSELKELIPRNRYFIKMNVSKSNRDIAEQILIKSIINSKPYSQNCIHAQKVKVGDICTSGTNMYSSFTGPRPSCVPYAEANVWYAIEAPQSGKLKLNSGADFYHVVAIYSGRCDKLEEIFCSKNPEKCNGYLEVKNLSPGMQYYVQIASAEGSFGYEYGNYCLEIIDGGSDETYVPMKIDAGITCTGNGFGHINYTVNGGKGDYIIEGNTVEDILHTGQQYGITVKDEWGCEVSYFDRVDCGTYDCQLKADINKKDVKCHSDASGAAEIHIKNASGDVRFEWSNGQISNVAKNLKAGKYTVTITDSKYCELIETVVINEPKPLSAGIDPVAVPGTTNNNYLVINANGGTAPYKYIWERNGQVIVNTKELQTIIPGQYAINVIDANNCKLQIRDIDIIQQNKKDNSFEWMVYPIPADKAFNIKLNTPNNETATFSLIDSRGLTIKTIGAGKNSLETIFPIQDVPSGIYLLQFKTGKHIDQRKVIIQR